MLLLANTSEKLQIVTGSAVTVDVHASYSDFSAGTVTPDRTNTAITTATTTDVVAAPGASTQRNIKFLSVRNKDVSPTSITVQRNVSATLYELRKVTLLAGETLVYVDGNGWKVIDSNGAIK